MADDRATLLDEAYKRGILPPDMKTAYEEAQKRGLVKAVEPSTKLQRFGTGLMDPIYGMAQIGARMSPEGSDIMAEPADYAQREQQKQAIDKTVREREVEYRAKRKAAGSEGFDWMRTGGAGLSTTALTAPLLAAGGISGAIAGGMAGGALQPTEGENFATEKAEQIGEGGLVGGMLGAGAKGAGMGVRSFGQWLAKEYPENIMTQAVATVLRRVNQDVKAGGPTAKDAIDLVNAANAAGKPMTLVDVTGKNVGGLAGNVARQPGESRNIAEKTLRERDQGAAQRVNQDIAKYVHGGDSMHKTTEALLQARSTEGKPAWAAVREMQGVWSPRLQQFIDDPSLRSGMARGYEIERLESLAEGRPFEPTQMGVDLDAEGNIKILAKPNMRVLHMAKMGLDAMIADERNEITGRLSARGVALDRVRSAYLNEIDSLDTAGIYKNARAKWEGRSASLDAVRAGRTMFQNSPEEIAAEFGRLTPANQEFYRIGVADAIRERVAKTGLNSDEAKSIIRNAWTRDQLRPIFRTPEDFNGFVDSVMAEGKMFSTMRKMLGGSETAERLAEDQSGENTVGAAAAHIASNLARGEKLYAVMNAWRRFRDLGIRPNPELNEQVAKVLFTSDLPPGGEVAQRLTGSFTGKETTNYLSPMAKGIEDVGSALAPGAAAMMTRP